MIPLEEGASLYTAIFVTLFEFTILYIVWRLRKLLVFVELLTPDEMKESAEAFKDFIRDRVELKKRSK